MATRSTQISDARSLLDEPVEAFYLDSEIVRWLNDADVIFAQEAEFTEFSSTANIVADQREYALPSTLTRIKAVYVNGNLVDPIDIKDEATFTNSGIANAALATLGVVSYFRQFGTNILLFPTPTSAITDGLKVIYYGTVAAIGAASSTATSALPVAFHDAASYYAAYKGKLKRQEYDKAAALQTIFKGRITDAKRLLHPRTRAGLPKVRDEDQLVYTPFGLEW